MRKSEILIIGGLLLAALILYARYGPKTTTLTSSPLEEESGY